MPLDNPYWQYSRDKKACEEYLFARWREDGFPVTVVRPSHTYDERRIPMGVVGKNGSWQVVKRIMEGKPVIIHGDGTSLGKEYDFTGGLIGDKANSVVFDNSKIKKLVPDFKAEISAREGIKRTVEYVLAHKECQKEDEEFDAWCDAVITAVIKLPQRS